MLATDAARAAPAGTGHDPRVTDRHGGTIGTTPTTSSAHATTDGDNRTAYLLATLRCAALRARLAASEIDAIGIALRGGMINPDTAVAWLRDCDSLEYLTPLHGAAL